MDFPVICTKRWGDRFFAWIDGDRRRTVVVGRSEREAISRLLG